MGSFRFLLAVMVVISHAHGGFAGYNIGIVAVISFFLISGYVMTVLVDRYYGTLSKIGLFYLDRSARLLPQYVLYLLLALSALALTRNSLLQSCGAYEFGLNLIIFPLDLYQLIDLKCMLIPQRPSGPSNAAIAAWPSKKLSVRRSTTRFAACSLPIAKVAR